MRNIVGPPVRGEDFFPRPNEVDQIWKELDAGNNIILSGPMKSGKTSILLHLKDNPISQYRILWFDFNDISGKTDLFKEIFIFLNSNIYDQSMIETHEDFKDGADYKSFVLFKLFQENIRLIIIIDNIPLIEKNDEEIKWTEECISVIENLDRTIGEAQKEKGKIQVILSVTGVYPIMKSPHAYKEVRLYSLTKNRAEEMCMKLTQGENLKISSEVINYFLFKLEWFSPYYIQWFIKILLEFTEKREDKSILPPLIDKALKKMEMDMEYFSQIQLRMKLLFTKDKYYFLIEIFDLLSNNDKKFEFSNLKVNTGGNFLDKQIKAMIQILDKEGVIKTISKSPSYIYAFTTPLFVEWWMHYKTTKLNIESQSSDESNGLKTIRIQKIIIRGIRCFEDVQINFDSTGNSGVIVGINGRGKSTILQLIALGFNNIKSVPFVHNWKNVVKTGNDIGVFEIESIYGDNPVRLKFEIDPYDDSIICKEGLDLLKSIKGKFLLLGYGVNRSVRLEDAKFHGDIEPFASLFGSNEYLKHIKISSSYESVKNNFKELKKFINRILEQSGGEGKVVLDRFDSDRFYFITPSNPNEPIPVEALSEGFKSTFVWLLDAILRIVEKGGRLENASQITGIVLIDEIDLHLHPSWQRTILGSIQLLFPNIQFIVTTHSPFVAQGVRKESLIVLEMDKENNSVKTADKEITSDLSYTSMVREVFDIPFPFSPEIEKLMNHYREMELRLRKEEKIDEEEFKRLVVDIAGRGVELEGIMRREIMSLEKRIGRTFDLWKK